MATTETSSRRRFTIDTNAIMTLIGAQAGSLQKALLEGVANAIDAGATTIDIQLDARRVRLSDNGRGLTEEDIYRHFEVFGFDHAHLGRKIGRFGVGRGQLFCFGRNTWTTQSFRMEIDIKASGLDYDLHRLDGSVSGTCIEIDLYQPLDVHQRHVIEEELRRLVRFSIVPVSFNGKVVSEHPEHRKGWTGETPDAWMRLKRDGSLLVYSQGLLVNEIGGYRYGVGGEVVTKPGHPLAQNLARNEIMEQNCAVWARVSRAIGKQAAALKTTAEASGTLTAAMRKSLAAEAITPEGAFGLIEKPLFTLTNGRHVKLEALVQKGVVAVAPTRDPVADRLLQRKAALVLDTATLERFGVEDLEGLRARLTRSLEGLLELYRADPDSHPRLPHWQVTSLLKGLSETSFHENLDTLREELSDTYEVVPDRLLTLHERAVLSALRKQGNTLPRQINGSLGLTHDAEGFRWGRSMVAMTSNTMDACTDGRETIWINRERLRSAKDLPGFLRLMSLLAHEYLHTENSRIGHQHDTAFYEAFHDVVLDSRLMDVALIAFGSFVRHGPGATRPQLEQLVQALDVGDAAVGTGELLAEAEAVEGLPPEKPTRRRARP